MHSVFDTIELIYIELKNQREMIEDFMKKGAERSIEEISLNRAAKLMHRSSYFLIAEVKAGRLKAVTRPNSKGKIRYRFRIADIHKYQDEQVERTFTRHTNGFNIETPEEIWERVKREADLNAKRNSK